MKISFAISLFIASTILSPAKVIAQGINQPDENTYVDYFDNHTAIDTKLLDWGRYSHEGKVIIDYIERKKKFILEDKTERTWAELCLLSYPTELTSNEGVTIECSKLGYDSSLGRVVFSTPNQGGWSIAHKVPMERFDSITQHKLSQFLLTLRVIRGDEKSPLYLKWFKGMVLEISPDMELIAFSPSIRLDPKSQIIPIKRNIYHIKYDDLDVGSMLQIQHLYKDLYKPLFEISDKIRLSKIKLLEALEEFEVEKVTLFLEQEGISPSPEHFINARRKWSNITDIYRGFITLNKSTYFVENNIGGLITKESLLEKKGAKGWDNSMTGNLNKKLIR